MVDIVFTMVCEGTKTNKSFKERSEIHGLWQTLKFKPSDSTIHVLNNSAMQGFVDSGRTTKCTGWFLRINKAVELISSLNKVMPSSKLK